MSDVKNLHQRLAAVMGEVTYIQKERKEKMQYTIVSHDSVTAKVRPALLSHGVIYYPVRCEHTHNGNRAECSLTVRFANIDDPADCIDVPTFGYGVDGQDKGPGKAMSYAVKYALLKALGLETGDDADHDNVNHTSEDPHATPVDHGAIAKRLTARLDAFTSLQDVEKFMGQQSVKAAIAGLPDNFRVAVEEAHKAAVARTFQAPADTIDDHIPYAGAAE